MYIKSRPDSMPAICVLGGTGFVGRHLVYRLADEGYRVRVVSRHRERHRFLLVHPRIELVEGDVNDLDLLRGYFDGCSIVINLVAILNERRRGDFQAIHVVLPGKIIQACRERGIHRLLHMSALNADAAVDTSRYLHSKGQGEKLVRAASKDLAITIFRPSVIFGPDDHFFNRFALLLKISPFVFPLVCPQARFAPVYVGDVVESFVKSLRNPDTYGKTFELCGPQVYTMRELVAFTARTLGLRRTLIGLGSFMSVMQARLLERLPGKLFTYDNYLSMQRDNVCHGAFPLVFGITPASIEARVPAYLAQQNMRGRFQHFRRQAHHSD